MGRWLVEYNGVAPASSPSGLMSPAGSTDASNSSMGRSMGMAMAPGSSTMHMMMMQMTFDLSDKVTLWISSWKVDSAATYAASLLGLFLLCILQEALTSCRARFSQFQQQKATKAEQGGWQHATHNQDGPGSMNGFDGISGGLASMPEDAGLTMRVPGMICSRLLLSLLYGVNLALAYLLMLAVMTYNVGYFIVIVSGLTFGHFLFFRWQQSSAMSDICHAQHEGV